MSVGTAAGVAAKQLVDGDVAAVQDVDVSKVQRILTATLGQRARGAEECAVGRIARSISSPTSESPRNSYSRALHRRWRVAGSGASRAASRFASAQWTTPHPCAAAGSALLSTLQARARARARGVGGARERRRPRARAAVALLGREGELPAAAPPAAAGGRADALAAGRRAGGRPGALGQRLRRTGLGARLCERWRQAARAAPSADGAPSPTLRRWPRARGLGLDDDDDAEAAAAAAAAAAAPTAARTREMVGEALHIAQPLVYLALFLLRHRRDLGASRHGAGRRRSGAARCSPTARLGWPPSRLSRGPPAARAAAGRRGASAAAAPPAPEGRTAALVAAADACVRWVVGGATTR